MILDSLHAERAIAAALHLEVRVQAFSNVDEAAREFGLQALGDKWRSIDRDTAALVLFALLIQDMAFSYARMSENDAKVACDEFLSQFDTDSLFFTNGNWEEGWTKSMGKSASFGPWWHPTTDASFDGGVIALDHSRSGILWLEDED